MFNIVFTLCTLSQLTLSSNLFPVILFYDLTREKKIVRNNFDEKKNLFHELTDEKLENIAVSSSMTEVNELRCFVFAASRER